MTREETGKLFTLLKQFFPNRNFTAQMSLAWELALEPYAYEEVKNAVVAHVRKSKFFPDIADLTAGLSFDTPEEKGAESGRGSLNTPASWMLPYLLPEDSRSVSRCAREQGLSWEEAKRRMGEGA